MGNESNILTELGLKKGQVQLNPFLLQIKNFRIWVRYFNSGSSRANGFRANIFQI